MGTKSQNWKTVILISLTVSVAIEIFVDVAEASHGTIYTFTAAGDHGNDPPFDAVLASINGLNPAPAFHLALGDLGYLTDYPGPPALTEETWCSKWSTVRPVLVTGNHETGEVQEGLREGNINKYITHCQVPSPASNFQSGPNKSANSDSAEGCTWPDATVQCYGKEYYFDYPATNPVMRVIVTTPQVTWDIKMKFVDSNGDNAWNQGETVILDADGSATYTTGDEPIAGNLPQLDTPLKTDSPTSDPVNHIRFVDTSSNTHWESGEQAIYDTNGNKVFDNGEPVIAGTGSPGPALLHDYTIESARRWTYDSCTLSGRHCKWVRDKIDSARQSSTIKWVVVAMHRNYIEISDGVTPAIGKEFFNMLVERKVDLILQAHSHNYQRTKQLAHENNLSDPDPCPWSYASPNANGITAGSFDAGCVITSGNRFVKGRGAVMVIAGTGGRLNMHPVLAGDPSAGYFDAYNAATHGYLKIQLTTTRMNVNFVPVDGTFFTDSFEIRPIRGDVNYDCVVNIQDLTLVGAAFGSDESDPSPPWNSNADLDLTIGGVDGLINIVDLVIVAGNFGGGLEQCP